MMLPFFLASMRISNHLTNRFFTFSFRSAVFVGSFMLLFDFFSRVRVHCLRKGLRLLVSPLDITTKVFLWQVRTSTSVSFFTLSLSSFAIAKLENFFRLELVLTAVKLSSRYSSISCHNSNCCGQCYGRNQPAASKAISAPACKSESSCAHPTCHLWDATSFCHFWKPRTTSLPAAKRDNNNSPRVYKSNEWRSWYGIVGISADRVTVVAVIGIDGVDRCHDDDGAANSCNNDTGCDDVSCLGPRYNNNNNDNTETVVVVEGFGAVDTLLSKKNNIHNRHETFLASCLNKRLCTFFGVERQTEKERESLTTFFEPCCSSLRFRTLVSSV